EFKSGQFFSRRRSRFTITPLASFPTTRVRARGWFLWASSSAFSSSRFVGGGACPGLGTSDSAPGLHAATHWPQPMQRSGSIKKNQTTFGGNNADSN
ncbi:MAG: hypothetical protein ACQETR_13640, partial [Thermodesulfobacteriota bacterium]